MALLSLGVDDTEMLSIASSIRSRSMLWQFASAPLIGKGG